MQNSCRQADFVINQNFRRDRENFFVDGDSKRRLDSDNVIDFNFGRYAVLAALDFDIAIIFKRCFECRGLIVHRDFGESAHAPRERFFIAV